MASPYKVKTSSSALGKASSKNNEGSAPLSRTAGTSPQKPSCPECGSTKTWKDGIRETDFGPVQRYLCRNCGYRFSDPGTKSQPSKHAFNGLGTSEGLQTIYTKPLKSKHDIIIYCRGQDETVKATSFSQKGLKKTSDTATVVKMEIPAKEKPAGGTEKQTVGVSPTDQASAKGKIIEFLWWMEKQGYAKETIRCSNSCLRTLIQKGADLLDPESVKEILAKEKSWSQSRRRNVINAYTLFLKFNELKWEKPKCKVERKIPFIPLEQEIDALIAGSGKKLAAFLQVGKETAFRAGEIKRLRWTNIDFEKRLIILNEPEKGSDSGIYKVSQRLIDMLNALPRESEYIFPNKSVNSLKATFLKTRKRLAAKLQNPRLLRISFHTLRHWKATMEYHKTKDILHVMKFLRHKKIDNTMIYVQLDQALFGDSEEYICRIAHNVGEAIALIEAGFEYVTGEYDDGGKIFRKRK